MALSEVATLIKGGTWLFLDLILTSVGGWLFWLSVSLLSTPTEVGFATTAFSLAILIGGLLSTGLDYTLLREVGSGGGKVYGSLLTLELALLFIASPVVYLAGLRLYGSFAPYMALAVAMMLAWGLTWVSRFALLGLVKSRSVLILDSAGIVAKLVVGIGLVLLGVGGIGIVAGALAGQVLMAVGLTLLSIKAIGFGWGGLGLIIKLVRLSLGNLPGRISSIVIMSLSVVLLAALRGDPAAVGAFYMASMISLFAAMGPAISLATIALPLSTLARSPVAPHVSLRLGLSISAPASAALISAPSWILGLLGKGYGMAAPQLAILALAIIPGTLLANATSWLNYRADLRLLTLLGLTQITSLLAPLPLLVAQLGADGMAYSILISWVASSVLGIIALGRPVIKPLTASLVALGLGAAIGLAVSPLSQPLAIILSVTGSLMAVFTMKGITLAELTSILRGMAK